MLAVFARRQILPTLDDCSASPGHCGSITDTADRRFSPTQTTLIAAAAPHDGQDQSMPWQFHTSMWCMCGVDGLNVSSVRLIQLTNSQQSTKIFFQLFGEVDEMHHEHTVGKAISTSASPKPHPYYTVSCVYLFNIDQFLSFLLSSEPQRPRSVPYKFVVVVVDYCRTCCYRPIAGDILCWDCL